MTQAMVRRVIDESNKKGELEIRVKRYASGTGKCTSLSIENKPIKIHLKLTSK